MIALTATATSLVQDDIAQQLGLEHSARFIHGFRRANLAIEVVEVAPSQRPALACELLLGPERRPGIVYTSPPGNRPKAWRQNSQFISPRRLITPDSTPTAASGHRRDFFAGKVEVIVATIAFGMGIDKESQHYPARVSRGQT